MKIIHALLLCLPGFLLPSLALAQSECDKQEAQIRAEPQLNMSNAERLLVRFQGYPELSNEYRVSADHTLSIPVIGRIAVDGMTAACLEETLTAAARRIAKRDVFLTIETVAYKPVFVTGIVAKPGAVPWFPDMTVLHAMTVAGGLFRSQTITTGDADVLKLQRLTANRRRLVARIARLRAELINATALPAPVEQLREAPTEVKAIYGMEEDILRSRVEARQNDAAALERSMAVARQEIEALEQGKLRVQEQLRLRRERREKINELQKKGFARQDQTLEEEIRVAELEQRELDNSVARTRLRATLAGLEREAGQLGLGHIATVTTEITELERQLQEQDLEIRQIRADSAAQPLPGAESPIAYTIVRRVRGETKRIEAAESDPLYVGDMLIVGYAVR